MRLKDFAHTLKFVGNLIFNLARERAKPEGIVHRDEGLPYLILCTSNQDLVETTSEIALASNFLLNNTEKVCLLIVKAK